MTDGIEVTGGCQCGRVRYSARLPNDEGYLCHCGMCRRATGGFAAAFVQTRKEDVRWQREPDVHRSSPIAERPFCSACGTPLGFWYPDSDHLDLTLGSLDEPERIRPTSHFAADTALEPWLDTSRLPRHALADNPRLVDRWMAACGKLPD